MREITSPSARFPGVVVLHDPLSYPQVVALEEAVQQAREADGAAADLALLPGLLVCVAEVRLEGIPAKPTPDTWPATPRKAAAELLRWLTSEIMTVYVGETEIPNA